MMTEPLAYLRGEFVPLSQARLAVYDAGVVAGTAVSQTLRTFGGRVFRLQEHLRRFQRSLDYVGIRLEHDAAALAAIVARVAEHNATRLPAGGDLAIVIFATPGPYAAYAPPGAPAGPTLCVHATPLPFHLWAHKLVVGQHLVTPGVQHVPAACVDPRIKQRSRIHYFLADQEARQRDPDAVALLLDAHGRLTETATANFFLVRGRTLCTPAAQGVMPGVSRLVTLELAHKLGIPAAECDLRLEDALAADEAFTTSTPYCLLPVARLNGQPIGRGERTIFPRLVSAWNELVGLDVHAQILRCGHHAPA